MDEFNQAIVDWKTRRSTGKWAKAIADTLEIEEEEGFDALATLFDASMGYKKCHNIECMSQDSYDCDDKYCMFEESPNADSESIDRCKTAANEIKKTVEDNPTKMAAVERMCPNWKENVEFFQAQTDPNALLNALQNEKAKEDLENMKGRILQAFLDRRRTLDLYESSIRVANDGLSAAKMTGFGRRQRKTKDNAMAFDNEYATRISNNELTKDSIRARAALKSEEEESAKENVELCQAGKQM